jgi:HK97 family phage prohead protease
MPAATAPQTKRLAFPVELKEVDGQAGVFTGYGNVFGVVDWYREVVVKGAFKKTLKDKKQSGKPIVLLWQHDSKTPIGTLEAVEDDHGLLVTATLTLGVQAADEAYLLLKSGAIGAMSIGFNTVKDDLDAKTGIRYLKEIALWEVSLVTFPANEASTVSTVKAADFAAIVAQEDLSDEWCRNFDAIRRVLWMALEDETTADDGAATVASSLAQFSAAMTDWYRRAKSTGYKSGPTPPEAKATTATPDLTEGTPPGAAEGKGTDGAGDPDPTPAPTGDVADLIAQLKADANQHQVQGLLAQLRAAS